MTDSNQDSKMDVRWNLDEIFTSTDDPRIDETISDLNTRVQHLQENYKGKINTKEFTAQQLKTLLQFEEQFEIDLEEIDIFSRFLFDSDMTSPENQAFRSKINNLITDLDKKLAFLPLEIGKLVSNRDEILNDPLLNKYKHFLKKLKIKNAFKLSELEEQLILEKDQYGVDSWSQLQSVWLNTRLYDVEVEGEIKHLSYADANGLLSQDNKKTRISANKSIYGNLGKDSEIFSTALRNICGDWVNNSKRRQFSSPLHESLIIQDVNQKTIENLMNTIESNVDIYRKYLNIKAKLMKQAKLGCEDIAAPLPVMPKFEYSWKQAKDLIMEAYKDLDLPYIKEMFEMKHIDASPRFGKRSGAYCHGWFKKKSAFMLQSFTNNLTSVFTLAHELGHCIHAFNIARNQTYLNSLLSMCVAETASNFGELLVMDLLLSKATSKNEKIVILTESLDGAGMSIFQVSARFWFETDLYSAIENGEHLDGKTISKYWTKNRDKIYGDAVEWFDEMDWEWAMKGHYFISNYRYYNYPYVYASLFVFALYNNYKSDKVGFLKKFKILLEAGGSLSAKELGDIMGFDVESPDFWQLGINQFESFLNELEGLMD